MGESMNEFKLQLAKVPASQKLLLLFLIAFGIFVAAFFLTVEPAEHEAYERNCCDCPCGEGA